MEHGCASDEGAGDCYPRTWGEESFAVSYPLGNHPDFLCLWPPALTPLGALAQPEGGICFLVCLCLLLVRNLRVRREC